MELLPSCGGRRVVGDNLHITVQFLGSITAQQRACAEAVAEAAAATRFHLQLDRAGLWPKPGILWLGAANPPQSLLGLVSYLHAGTGRCGIPVDARPFKPHVTLWRKLRSCGPVPDLGPVTWNVTDFCLVQSVTGPDGARYAVLKTWPLER